MSSLCIITAIVWLGGVNIIIYIEAKNDMQPIQCERCTKVTPSYDIVHYGSVDGGHWQLCTQCFNAEIQKLNGDLNKFENIRLEPVAIVDCTGETHDFHFQIRLMGNIVSLDAFELRDGCPSGYKFRLVGDPEEDLFTLSGRLIQKIRHALSLKHITDGELGLQIIDTTARGRIEWDDAENGRVPLVVIDGREISWDKFGEMLMAFEGWNFKLEIIEPSDDA